MAFVDISPPIYVSIPKNNGMTVEMPRHPGAVVPIPSGAQGLPGEPGFSPVVSVEEITGGNRVTITDAEGETSFDVMNGAQGEQGEPGEGVPTGGGTGQVLKKRSNTDYDTYWANESGTVLSVNGMTGAVVLDADDVGALPDDTFIPTKTSDLTNDSGFVNANQAATAAPVQSVDGRAGDVTTLSNATPSPLGTASHGSANYAARADHVHAMPSADDVGAMSKWELLWTNASPSSDFAAQTIALDLSGYDAVIIQIDQERVRTYICFVGYQYDFGVVPTGYTPSTFGRLATVSSSGIEFGAGYYNTGANNGVNKPTKIYGIKGVG